MDGWFDDPEWRDATAVLDGRSLRAVAHPLRMRLLGLLRTHGPSTASRLAGQVGESSGSTSYHLRQLARFDLVEELAGHGTQRERWWRARHRSMSWEPGPHDDEELRTAQDVLWEAQLAAEDRAVRRFAAQRTGETAAWLAASPSDDYVLRLTAEQAGALVDDLRAVVRRHQEAAEAAPEPGARGVHLFLRLVPIADTDTEP